ncbi:DUF3168 domain-containing protein [Streptomyces sp. NRRL F-5135]|uniref:DUF3168 domain-containing protein n=1 Tax=Streptomyces sp. NRRL F-5135 TaxID=1463858 RepID=UPI0004CA9A11|nr:DUF3168 domain-containing protein [Streptomyces sp. NRRL F-5135]
MPPAPAPVAYPDAVEVYVRYVRAQLATRAEPVHVATRVPDDRPARFVTVGRIGGARQDLITDRARLDIHCWAPDEGTAWDLVQLVRALTFAVPGRQPPGVTVYDLAEVGGPNLLPDPHTSLPRYAFAVEMSVRGRALT